MAEGGVMDEERKASENIEAKVNERIRELSPKWGDFRVFDERDLKVMQDRIRWEVLMDYIDALEASLVKTIEAIRVRLK